MEPNTKSPLGFDWTLFSPDYATYQPFGPYEYCKVGYTWAVPGIATIKISPEHRHAATVIDCRRTVRPLRTYRNGVEWSGRVMQADIEGEPGREDITLTLMSNLFWLLTILFWVNPLLPPVFQLALTGKQDIMVGPLDFVFKYFLSKNVIRQGAPIHMRLPLRLGNPTQPNIEDISDIDELLTYVNGIDLIAASARFTQADELYKMYVDNGEVGMEMPLFHPALDGPSPQVFNTSALSYLQSIIDMSDDNFLNFSNPGNVLGLGDPSKWNKVYEPGYIFHTKSKRNRAWQIWATDSGLIKTYKRTVVHATASRAIVGGQAPELLNSLIEFAANLAVQAIAAAITLALGLAGVGAIAVGGLFDDLFFAFQEFVDYELEDDLGPHGFRETFGNNTNAWTLDAFSVGLAALKAKGGSDDVTMNVVTSGLPDRGMAMGLDIERVLQPDGSYIEVDVSQRRYQVGDIVTFWDRGSYVPNWISGVDIEDARMGFMVEAIKLGDSQQSKEIWGQVIDRLKGISSLGRAQAVQSS